MNILQNTIAYLADSLFLGASGADAEVVDAAAPSRSPGGAHVAAQVNRLPPPLPPLPLPPPPAKAASAAALRLAAPSAVSSWLSSLFSSRPTGASKRTALLLVDWSNCPFGVLWNGTGGRERVQGAYNRRQMASITSIPSHHHMLK